MPRHLVATLFIGLTIGIALSVLYNTEIFQGVGRWIQGMLAGTFLEPPPGLSIPLQCGVAVVLACGTAWVGVDTQSITGRILVTLLAVFVVAMLVPTLALYGQLFEPVSGSTAVILGIVGGSLYSRTEPGKRRHFLRNLLGGRADPAVIKRLTKAKQIPQLEGVSRPATAVSCRIINRNELASALESGKMADLTKKFQALCNVHLMRHGGVLDPGSPDYVRAHFGLIPLPKTERDASPDDTSEESSPNSVDSSSESESPQPSPVEFTPAAVASCRAALELAPHIHTLSSNLELEFGHRIIAGIGIESGLVTTCLTGDSPSQLGAIGEIAEFSLRLSAANHQYESDILIGPMTFLAAQEEIDVRPVEMFYNPATKHLTEIYQLVDEKGFLSEPDQERLKAFWEGVILLRREEPALALEKLNEARDARKVDTTLQYFMDKARTQLDDQPGEQVGTRDASQPSHARSSSEI